MRKRKRIKSNTFNGRYKANFVINLSLLITNKKIFRKTVCKEGGMVDKVNDLTKHLTWSIL